MRIARYFGSWRPRMSATEVQGAYARALMVDRIALDASQEANDALMATQTLEAVFRTDVEPILIMARLRAGGAINRAYRAKRVPRASGGGGPSPGPAGDGIV